MQVQFVMQLKRLQAVSPALLPFTPLDQHKALNKTISLSGKQASAPRPSYERVKSLSGCVFRNPGIQRQRLGELGGLIHEVTPQIFL